MKFKTCMLGSLFFFLCHWHRIERWSSSLSSFFATSSSTLSNATESYHQVNSLYNGNKSYFSTLAQSRLAANETFTYKEALQQSDYHDFFKAMIHEVNNHKTQDHCTCHNMLIKLIMAFGHNELVELIGRVTQTISPKIQTQLIVVFKQKHQRKPQQDLVDPWSAITISMPFQMSTSKLLMTFNKVLHQTFSNVSSPISVPS
jgi:hypothetical protein